MMLFSKRDAANLLNEEVEERSVRESMRQTQKMQQVQQKRKKQRRLGAIISFQIRKHFCRALYSPLFLKSAVSTRIQPEVLCKRLFDLRCCAILFSARRCVIVVVKKSRHEKYLFLICFFKSRQEKHFCGSCFFKSGHGQ